MPWQPIETAPKDGTVIDLWVTHTEKSLSQKQDYAPVQYRVPDCRWCDGGPLDKAGWYSVSCGYGGDIGPVEYNNPFRCQVATHWMPLPQPPA